MIVEESNRPSDAPPAAVPAPAENAATAESGVEGAASAPSEEKNPE